MTPITNFDMLTAHLVAKGIKQRIVAVCPRDASSQEALQRAEQAGFTRTTIVDNDNPLVAASEAVKIIRRGEGDILMKGLIGSDILLRAILDREQGLLQHGRVLTHIALAHIPALHRMVAYSDAAVIPHPTAEQRSMQINYLATMCRTLGIDNPRIALIHCSEKVNERHFPYTADYPELIRQSASGAFGKCIIDGPLDVKTALSAHALAVKGIASPIEGRADAMVFPEIESANTFYKTITLLADATIASTLQGTDVPVVLPSRGDDASSKYYSLALAALSNSNIPSTFLS